MIAVRWLVRFVLFAVRVLFSVARGIGRMIDSVREFERVGRKLGKAFDGVRFERAEEARRAVERRRYEIDGL